MGKIRDFYVLTEADISKGHTKVYDSRLLRNDFEAAGFEVEHLGGLLLKPLSHAQMDSWDEEVVDAFYKIGQELPDYCSSLIIVGRQPRT